MSGVISTYTIKSFPNDGKIWRLAWFGKLSINPSARSEPTIDVIVVPLKSKNINEVQDFNSKNAYDHSQTKIVQVATGLFPILRLGSFWVNGVEVLPKKTPYKEELFTVTISNHTSFITDFTTNEERNSKQNFNISFQYPEVDTFPLSKILIINDSKAKLIIPCTEIFRYYYGSSSQLARALLTGKMEIPSNNIYDPDLSKCVDGKGYLKLRRTIPDEEAAAVARIAFCEYANKQAKNIYQNLLKFSSHNPYSILEVKPPFEATTTLTIRGKWVQSQNMWYCFIFQILTCSAPFPFQTLSYERDNDGRSVGDNEEKASAWENARRRFIKKNKRKKAENIITHENEPDVNLELTKLEILPNADRFTDLQGKIVKKAEKTDNQFQGSDNTFLPHENNNEFSTGAGTKGQTPYQPLAVVSKNRSLNPGVKETGQSQRNILPSGISNFAEILASLAQLPDITYQPIQIIIDNDWPELDCCSYFPLYSNNIINTWAYLDFDNNLRRQIVIYQVIYQAYYVYLCDIEIDQNNKNDRYAMIAVHGAKFQQLSLSILGELIYGCANNHGRWLNPNQLTDVERKKFKHNMNSIAGYAERFYHYIKFSVAKTSINSTLQPLASLGTEIIGVQPTELLIDIANDND